MILKDAFPIPHLERLIEEAFQIPCHVEGEPLVPAPETLAQLAQKTQKDPKECESILRQWNHHWQQAMTPPPKDALALYVSYTPPKEPLPQGCLWLKDYLFDQLIPLGLKGVVVYAHSEDACVSATLKLREMGVAAYPSPSLYSDL